MAEVLTKSRARNVFNGGSVFVVVVFIALSVQSHRYVVTTSTAGMALTEEVALCKRVRERHSCINCHTLHGEGAYFAPEVGNVMTRWGVLDDPDSAYEILYGWMKAQPSGIEGRRQMPHFEITEEEMRGLAEFLPRRCSRASLAPGIAFTGSVCRATGSGSGRSSRPSR